MIESFVLTISIEIYLFVICDAVSDIHIVINRILLVSHTLSYEDVIKSCKSVNLILIRTSNFTLDFDYFWSCIYSPVSPLYNDNHGSSAVLQIDLHVKELTDAIFLFEFY